MTSERRTYVVPHDWSGFEGSSQGKRAPSGAWTNRGHGTPLVEQRPETALQALMEAAPHADVVEPEEEVIGPRERLVFDMTEAMAKLPEPLPQVLDCVFNLGMSLAETGAAVGVSKTQAGRLRDAGLAALKDVLMGADPMSDKLRKLIEMEKADGDDVE